MYTSILRHLLLCNLQLSRCLPLTRTIISDPSLEIQVGAGRSKPSARTLFSLGLIAAVKVLITPPLTH
ncbi:hypothetical protein J6590_053106 [Homalodisca vitripennis]|nr:hypothetical protein J6590_053106 [Homalodisca vitripennis]